MIGNDVIDLKIAAAQSDPLRSGFLEKVFSKKEQYLIEAVKQPVFQVWVLWAMKEAAYKANQRHLNLQRLFNPQKLECSIIKQTSTLVTGMVDIEDLSYHTSVTLTKEYLHATASPFQKVNKILEVFPISANVKVELMNRVSNLYSIPRQFLSIRKNSHFVPFLYIKDVQMEQAFSLSHHGNYAAFSLSLTNY